MILHMQYYHSRAHSKYLRYNHDCNEEPSRLEARHLKKFYGSREVVKDVSLTVRKGEVVGLLGPNGAGKTTSFYMIVGLVRASAGEINIDDERVEHMPIQGAQPARGPSPEEVLRQPRGRQGRVADRAQGRGRPGNSTPTWPPSAAPMSAEPLLARSLA
ncbi:ATP-binding cassette domain-containing protein [Mycobacterium tuberculosis]|uniref:ATP-binding cassette domain-containing protein n=1 Tax=Mycobacterium tuberculosis TaxID=1773 RepID=UPI00272AC29B|nr:ATP-binding cassette domain-containing protein [Mycobacterium tuberculosis]